MRKIISIFALLLTVVTFAQEAPTVETTSSKVTYYASVGLSVTNLQTKDADGNTVTSDFEDASYPSVEFGVTKGNLSFGAVVGRGNLNFKNDDVSAYFYELKTSLSQPVGNANIYGLFGLGNYVDQNHIFIEYGAGLSYSPTKLGYFVQASNWDGVWYVTPGLTYNF